MSATLQDHPPNFRDEDGNLFLVRCFACGGPHGRENYLLAVASGICSWCGWAEFVADWSPDIAAEGGKS